jgi:hypothetical protein
MSTYGKIQLEDLSSLANQSSRGLIEEEDARVGQELQCNGKTLLLATCVTSLQAITTYLRTESPTYLRTESPREKKKEKICR